MFFNFSGFSSWDSLMRHMKTVHKKEKWIQRTSNRLTMIIFSKSNKVEIKVYQFVVEFETHTHKRTRYYTTIATMIIAKCPFSLNLSKAEKKNESFLLQYPWFRGFLIRTVHNLLLYSEEAYQPSLVKVVSKKLKSKLMFQTGVVGFSSLPLPIDWNRKMKGNHYK